MFGVKLYEKNNEKKRDIIFMESKKTSILIILYQTKNKKK